MQIYLAGPMTGLPDYNYPAFHRYAAMLRDWGYSVTNPAENPTPPCGTWDAYMAMALPQVRAAQLVIFLPGWKKSRGARKEHALAQRLGIPCLELLSNPPPPAMPTPLTCLPCNPAPPQPNPTHPPKSHTPASHNTQPNTHYPP